MKRALWAALWPFFALAQTTDTDLRALDRRFHPHPYIEPSARPPRHAAPPGAPVSYANILASPLNQRVIVKGATLVDNAGGTTLAPKDTIVEVHDLPDERGYFYLPGKEGGTFRARVHGSSLFTLADVTEMYEPPRQYSAITEAREHTPYDRHPGWRAEALFGQGRTRHRWTADALDRGLEDTFATRLGASALFDWQGRFQLGPTFQYETAAFEGSALKANYHNPSFGLAVKSGLLGERTVLSRVGAQFRTGPFARLDVKAAPGEGLPARVPLNVTSLLLSWENVRSNRVGDWSWGLSWQREWVSLRRQEGSVALRDANSTNDQMSVFVTQGFAL